MISSILYLVVLFSVLIILYLVSIINKKSRTIDSLVLENNSKLDRIGRLSNRITILENKCSMLEKVNDSEKVKRIELLTEIEELKSPALKAERLEREARAKQERIEREALAVKQRAEVEAKAKAQKALDKIKTSYINSARKNPSIKRSGFNSYASNYIETNNMSSDFVMDSIMLGSLVEMINEVSIPESSLAGNGGSFDGGGSSDSWSSSIYSSSDYSSSDSYGSSSSDSY